MILNASKLFPVHQNVSPCREICTTCQVGVKNGNLTFGVLRFSSGHPPRITYDYTINSERIVLIIITETWAWACLAISHGTSIKIHSYKTLGLIRRSLSSAHNPSIKNDLCLVRLQLTYCSQIFGDHISWKMVQRRTTNDFSSGYNSRLMELKIFPLMMQLELNV